MTDHYRALQISLAFHVLIFLLSVIAAGSDRPVNKPLIIDFTAGDSAPRLPLVNLQNPEIKNSVPRTPVLHEEREKEARRPENKILPPAEVSSSTPLPATDARHFVPVSTGDERESGKSTDVQGSADDISGTKAAYLPLPDRQDSKAGGDTASSVIIAKNKDGYLKQNFSYIRDMIQKKITYPRFARQMGWIGRVLVSFIICADGSVKDIKIAESSGIELLDKNAVEAVKKALPLPRPPVEAQVIIPIKYSLN